MPLVVPQRHHRYPQGMKNIEPTHPKDGFILLPSVTHPQGREKAFDDCFKALVRTMVESMDNPAIAYAIDKTDRLVTEANMDQLSDEELHEWTSACAEFEAMPAAEQQEWIEQVRATYPRMEDLPDLDLYNLMN